MKSDNSKLLLGLGLGALVGVAVGYLMTGEHRQKLEEELHEVGHGIKDGVKSVFSKVKLKAEHAGSEFAGKADGWSEKAGEKAQEWSEKAGDKAEEWADEAGNKASAAADNFSRKANDMREEMDSKSTADTEAYNKYSQNFRQDVNDLKDKTKGGKEDKTFNTNKTTY